MFREDRHVGKKKRERLGKIIKFSIEFSSKIDPKSSSKSGKTAFATKTASGAVFGLTFSPPGSFLVDFGLPAGPQNGAKTAPGAREILFFGPPFFVFWHSCRSDALR